MTLLGEIERTAPAVEDLGVLRFITAGSVDDGKSTLIGRLLHDTRAIFEDQLAAVARASQKRGQENIDLSLLTDGLEAEREQGITIDVAYRYFTTPRRKFIIADTPGHEQYTRNMVTGASTADAAVILIDARKGVLPQTRRHTYIAHLLGVRHIVVAVNKMDLVGFDETVFERIRKDFLSFSSALAIADLLFIPISALRGDLVVERGESMSWYRGPTLLAALEEIDVADVADALPFRFPVQLVVRAGAGTDFRGYSGRIESGALFRGAEILALPSGRRTVVKDIVRLDSADGKGDRGTHLLALHPAPSCAGPVGHPVCPQAHHAQRESEAYFARLARRRRHPRAAGEARGSGDERYRARGARARPAALRRFLRVEPRHRVLYPDRRNLQPDRSGRNDRWVESI